MNSHWVTIACSFIAYKIKVKSFLILFFYIALFDKKKLFKNLMQKIAAD